MIKIGDPCPHFVLNNQKGDPYPIKEHIGEKILCIYFYPKDDTPGCIKEACSFRDNFTEFQDMGCEVIGISSNSIQEHKDFAAKYNLPFNLLADSQKEVRKAFGVPSNLFGIIPGRVTYIIDKNGIVQGIYNTQTQPLHHIKHALEKVKELISKN